MNVLITGASGTIGSTLTERLLATSWKIHCQSRQSLSSSGAETWICFDLLDAANALRSFPEWDLVFHLAAQTSILEASKDPVQALRDNVLGFAALLQVLRSQSRPAFVVNTGTVTQVGLPDTTTITEELRDDPVTLYDLTKLTAELLLKQYVSEGWVRGCSLRLATVFGATSANQSADRGVIDKVMRAAIDGRPINVYGKGDFLRDYIHIEDVVEALLAAANHPDAVNGQSFVIGSGQGVTLRQAFMCAADIAAELTGRRVEVGTIEPPGEQSPIDFRSAVVDPSAFREATGWEPHYDLKSGLLRSYDPTR